MKDIFKKIDMTDFFFFVLSIGLLFLLIVCGINLLIDAASDRETDFEEHCVEYYLENNYILTSCEKYRDRFEVSE